MSTVYIDHRDADIDVDGDRLVVRSAGERKGTVPLRLVERIVVVGSARLTTRLVTRLRTLGIGLVVAGSRFDSGPVGVVPAGGDAALRLAQYDLAGDAPARLAIARPLVARKIESEAGLLHSLLTRQRGEARLIAEARRQLLDAAGRLRAGTAAPHLGALMGHEGAAAAAYFAAFVTAFAPALGFAGRNRRPPRDPVNVCLSIGYTILHFEALQAVAREGLDPLIGVYHDLRAGRDSLACDLVEPVRAGVDGFVHDLFAEGRLRPDSFTGGGAAGCNLGKAGRTAYYRAFEEVAAAGVRERLASEAAALARAIGARVAGRPGGLAASPRQFSPPQGRLFLSDGRTERA
jgi:CRISPR-associated protein Cas1